MQTSDLPELLNAKEVALLFRVAPTTVFRWGRAGILPMVKAGRSRRFHRADVEALLEPQPTDVAS